MNVASKAKQGEYQGYAIKDYPFAPARHPPSPATERFEGAMHIHTMVRTPNGNDYGKALLKTFKKGR